MLEQYSLDSDDEKTVAVVTLLFYISHLGFSNVWLDYSDFRIVGMSTNTSTEFFVPKCQEFTEDSFF